MRESGGECRVVEMISQSGFVLRSRPCCSRVILYRETGFAWEFRIDFGFENQRRRILEGMGKALCRCLPGDAERRSVTKYHILSNATSGVSKTADVLADSFYS